MRVNINSGLEHFLSEILSNLSIRLSVWSYHSCESVTWLYNKMLLKYVRTRMQTCEAADVQQSMFSLSCVEILNTFAVMTLF